MTTVIKTTSAAGTYLKVTPDYPAVAPENAGSQFVLVNTELTLTDIAPVEKKHRKITLTKCGTNESKTWYIYDPHWAVVISNDPDHIANIPKPITGTPITPATSSVVYTPFVQKQVTSLSKYSTNGKINLDTSCKYFSQRDNYTMQHRTCNSSANAMYLNWLQRASGQANILNNDDEYLKLVLSKGDTIYHENQTWALRQYGFKTVWDTDGEYSKLKELVLAGFVVPINIHERRGMERRTDSSL